MSAVETLDIHGEHYQLMDKLAERAAPDYGLISRVYKGWNQRSQDTVILKGFQLTDERQRSRVRDMFAEERRLMNQIRNNKGNIPMRKWDAEGADGQFWLCMEYIAGDTWAKRLDASPQLPDNHTMRQILGWGEDIATTLGVFHSQKVAHRDVTPANIIIDTRNHARLIDLGLAALRPAVGEEGTRGYRAPEQQEVKPAELLMPGMKSDIYGLAAVLYHALTGGPPRVVPGVALKPPSMLNSAVPPELDELLVQMLAQHPDHRPAIATVRTKLNAVRQHLGRTVVPGATVGPADADPAPALPPAAATALSPELATPAAAADGVSGAAAPLAQPEADPDEALDGLYNEGMPQPTLAPPPPALPRHTPADVVRRSQRTATVGLVLLCMLLVGVVALLAWLVLSGRWSL
ncbi:MAG: serine/threonine protein kinase [Chloroflexaceae bacterium]|nr:serine/threonine protein kinase [Chloroflexaceae bacterium]